MTTTTTTAGELELAGWRRQVAELYATVRQAPTPQEGHALWRADREVAEEFVTALGINEISLYVFDFGAPVGFRLASRRPDLVRGLVVQNGNAYEEGLSVEWAPIRAY